MADPKESDPRSKALDLNAESLTHILEPLGGAACAQAACVHPTWRDTLADERLWRALLERDFDTREPVLPGACGGGKAESYREAYAAWRAEYSDVPAPYLARALRCWHRIEAWLAQHAPAVAASLRPGAMRADIEEAEVVLSSAKFPPAVRALYRVHDGQELRFDYAYEERQRQALGDDGFELHSLAKWPHSGGPPPSLSDSEPSIAHGLFGGYSFYEHCVNTRLLSLRRAVIWTCHLNRRGLLPPTAPGVRIPAPLLVAASYNLEKVVQVSLRSGGVSAGLMQANYSAPASSPDDTPGACDGMLRWFEEYARRLESGAYDVEPLVDELPSTRTIGLFPRAPPGAVAAITRGVRVRAAPLFVPELYQRGRATFAYRISFALLGGGGGGGGAEEPQGEAAAEEEGGGGIAGQASSAAATSAAATATAAAAPSSAPPLVSCQLVSRHWRVLDADGALVDEVSGDGVVGLYPLLKRGGAEVSYQSCTVVRPPGARGAMEGWFEFVEGSTLAQTGPRFRVACPRMHFEVPDYCY